MKKIFLLLCFLLVPLMSYANTPTSTLNWTLNDGSHDCPSVVSHGVTHYGVPNSNVADAGASGGLVACTNHNYYSSSDHIINVTYNNGGITACPVGEMVTFYNGSNQITCRKYDDISPTISDNYIYDGVWINSGSVLISFNIIEAGGSGIKQTKWCTGVSCNPATGTTTSNPNYLTISADFNNTIWYQTWDNAGNPSNIGPVVVKIQKPLITHSGAESLEGIKVIGKVHDTSVDFINEEQIGNTINILGDLTKSSLKRDIRSNAYSMIKSINHNSTASSSSINNLSGNDWSPNTGGKILANNKILYYNLTGGEVGKNIVLNGASVGGNKTIIIKGGNLYITSNMTYSSSNSTLGIIVLKDDNGNGGNVYIKPSVTNIVGSIYADKSVLSYDTTYCASGELTADCGGTQAVLSSQLYILGQVFAENTIGGANMSPYKCPYYISTCTQNIARKYDFNFLRLYSVYDSDLDGDLDSVTNGGNYYFNSSHPYFKYPLVIKYNPQIQLTPSPLFGENK